MENKSKVTAAVSAVLQYIRTEEEAVAMQAAMPASGQVAPAPAFNLWSISGRQALMQMRNLMQMRTFHRSR
jgi:hypothetical protein